MKLVAPAAFTSALASLGISLATDTVETLARYLSMLLEANRLVNLTSVREPDEAWIRHGLDCLSIVSHVPADARVIDVGCGAGLPGLVLAIARRDVKVTLLEATGKKARFCRDVAKRLSLEHVSIANERAETLAHDPAHRESYDVATARAVTAMPELLELTLPFVRGGGHLLAMKGAAAESELARCDRALSTLGAGALRSIPALPGVRDDAKIILVEKVAPTPPSYPRRPGIPAKRPL